MYAIYIPDEGHLQAGLVAYPRLDALDLDLLLFFSVSATGSKAGAGQSSTIVVLIYKAAPPQLEVRSCTMTGTAAFKSVPLLPAVLI